MSLATRCTACGTVFRVVQDQLKVSEGWVRCGRCKEVFNALESLFDLEREAPPEWRPPQPVPTGAAGLDDLRQHEPALAPFAADAPDEPSPALSFPSIVDPEPEARRPSMLPDEPAEPFIEPSWAISEMPPAQDGDAAPGPVDDGPAQAPAFMRDERRAPQRPALRAAWAGAAVALLLLLAGQAGYHYRDALAADSPAMRPVITQACAWLGCRIEAPRRIEDIAVESSTLTQADANAEGGADAGAMRLSVVLRNRATVALAMPTIDLSLTDTSGALVSRRALSAADFRSPGGTLAPSAETTLQLLLSTAGRRVSGYTVEVFYP